METPSVEVQALEYWECSRAWKGDPAYAAGQTYQTVIERLYPLYTGKTVSRALERQADELVDLMARGKRRRKKGEVKGSVTRVDFTKRTKISGPSNKAKAA